ncbi:Uncharacterised protein [Myroides odoratus]|nr:hypothetical protein Myrod_2144 [Myroides odoratus DSM 2801]EKB07280.1 hypothetical protein HMPREF9716_02003 [Myroides odoratus CIP 103059]STZ30238.1 Uncharacterised protein [Myroides odoratus]
MRKKNLLLFLSFLLLTIGVNLFLDQYDLIQKDNTYKVPLILVVLLIVIGLRYYYQKKKKKT